MLEEKITGISAQRLMFNITEYPTFLNLRKILQEVHLLSSPDIEHKTEFCDVTIAGFRNGKTQKYYLDRAALPKINQSYDLKT